VKDINNRRLGNRPRVQVLAGINIVVFMLSLIAGWVDTAGIVLFLNGESGFMTGRIHILAYHLFNLDFQLFFGVILVIIAFVIGSFVSTIVTEKMGLKGGLIVTGILILVGSLPVSWEYISIIFLPMAMGCQNATTSLTPLKRTTHLSGTTTDFGINLAKRNWNKVIFGVCSLIGFPLGSLIGYKLANMVGNNIIHRSIIFIISTAMIMLTGMIQEKTLNIPLLD